MKFHLFIYLSVFSLFCGYSQNIYNKDALTVLADSLDTIGDYEKALSIRKEAIKVQSNASKDYKAYLEAKYYHTNSSKLEFKSYNYHDPLKPITKKEREQLLDSALQSAIKARDLYITVKHPDKMLQYQIQNRIFHQTAYLGNWKHALEQAQLGYNFLKDTLSNNDKTFVDLIYDIGYIYSKLGDYSKSVENYQSSLDLYKNIIGENSTDVALAYNNIAVEYRYLGLRKKELESLHKAEAIWEQLQDQNNQQFLYRCYGNLFYWYSYYGDFEKAEEYILKKNKLRTIARTTDNNILLRNKEEIYKDKLSEWYDLMVHYSRKKDTIKTIFYAENIIKSVNVDEKLLDFEAHKLSSTLKFYASLKNETNSADALILLDKAIDIQENYKDIFFTDPFTFQLYKAELLFKSQKYSETKILLDYLNNLSDPEKASNKFKLAILNAKLAQDLNENKKTRIYFDEAFLLLNDSNKDIEHISIEDLKPLISFEIIEGFLAMGDFYMQLYKAENSNENLKKATHRYLLASKIYNQLYLGQRYNENLFTQYNDINKRLLEVAMKQPDNMKLLSEILNTIENNGSKLTWSKFVFNNQRQQFDISENFINQEENLKAQLHFYQDILMNPKANTEEKIALWKNKIYELKNDLSKIQDSIKEQNQTYYQLNVKNFEIANLQKSLKADEFLIKYILTDNYLYAFLISRNNIELEPATDKNMVLSALKISLNALKHRELNYQESFQDLSQLLFPQIAFKDYKKLIIIPDGALNYFPFEVLFLEAKIPRISYASSMLLYLEQKNISSTSGDLNIGAFSASNNNSNLPKVSDEIQAILNIFNGKAFLNATKTEFLKQAKSFNILHLAMHSNINELQPEFSSLNFYGENDNKLFINELYNETLNANMVVLSACDTGNGFYENGEGVISLSRAFNYAGIPSTVMSLWKVDDDATAKIMTYFYKHLKDGETKDEALKKAKLAYLENTEDELLRHPYYWSGFVITGNTDALVEPENYWMCLLILPFIVIGFFRKKLIQFFKK
jgi:CHAT domain-containing protein/tetratricopeptide (TPR) repeat protein